MDTHSMLDSLRHDKKFRMGGFIEENYVNLHQDTIRDTYSTFSAKVITNSVGTLRKFVV